MKRTLLIFGALYLGLFLSMVMADPPAGYDPVPLPPGPIQVKAPDTSAWRIDYSYTSQSTGSNGSAPPTAGGLAASGTLHLPKTLIMTRTKPLWHAVMIDLSGVKNEAWYDGTTRFQQVSPSHFIPISNGMPGAQMLKSYFSDGDDFPDIEWVSSQTYLGTQRGTGFWVFQQPGQGAMLWVNASNHFPVRWTKGGETRVFESLPTPIDPLVLPPSIARISAAIKHLDALSRVAPTGL